MTYTDCRTALETQLATLSSSPPVAWENIEYEPVTGTTYLRPTFAPHNTEAAALGNMAQTLYEGLFLIDIFTPYETGPQGGDTLADEINTLFKWGTHLTINGSILTIKLCLRHSPIEDPPWYMVPMTVEWYAYMP